MTVEEAGKIDFTTIDPASGDVYLVVSDHLGWEQEGEHLLLLQEKLNSYLACIESGELYAKFPKAIGRRIVIQVTGKFPLSNEAHKFYRLAGKAIEDAGFSLIFKHLKKK
jgi:hypothetical protein